MRGPCETPPTLLNKEHNKMSQGYITRNHNSPEALHSTPRIGMFYYILEENEEYPSEDSNFIALCLKCMCGRGWVGETTTRKSNRDGLWAEFKPDLTHNYQWLD